MFAILGGFVGPYFVGFAKDLTGNEQSGMIPMAAPMLAGAAIIWYLRRRELALRLAEPANPDELVQSAGPA
jgi:ACS family tartrate transporter-like MFS transporter